MRTMAHALAALVLVPGVLAAQEPENRASVTVHGLVLTATLDHFEYGATDLITATYVATNLGSDPVSIDAAGTCAGILQEEQWCDPASGECVVLPFIQGYCLPSERTTYPPGRTWLGNRTFPRGWPVPAGYVFNGGRVLFTDPWSDPPKFYLVLEYDRRGIVSVQSKPWGAVKQLYRD